jgi:hypothetical protein
MTRASYSAAVSSRGLAGGASRPALSFNAIRPNGRHAASGEVGREQGGRDCADARRSRRAAFGAPRPGSGGALRSALAHPVTLAAPERAAAERARAAAEAAKAEAAFKRRRRRRGSRARTERELASQRRRQRERAGKQKRAARLLARGQRQAEAAEAIWRHPADAPELEAGAGLCPRTRTRARAARRPCQRRARSQAGAPSPPPAGVATAAAAAAPEPPRPRLPRPERARRPPAGCRSSPTRPRGEPSDLPSTRRASSAIRLTRCSTTTASSAAGRRRPSGGLAYDARATTARRPPLGIEQGRRHPAFVHSCRS